jgi:RNA polymerase sigma-70 factor (ECF subfamily)
MKAVDSTLAIPTPAATVEALYRADAERLWRAVFAFCADPDIASDAVAEAYAQLLRRGDSVRDAQAWTWRTAFVLARGALKGRSQAPIPLEPSDAHADDAHIDRYGDPDLLAALARLPDGQRAALVLYYYADLPASDIATHLGTSSLVVRANLSRGRRRLRSLLGEHDG